MRIVHPAFAFGAGIAFAASLSACSSPSHQAREASGGDHASSGGSTLSHARLRERDVLAALPLARRVERVIRSHDKVVFTFEGFFEDRDLICVRALPDQQEDTVSVSTYVYERGRLLGFTHQIHKRDATPGPREIETHGLFGPDGAPLAFETIVDGKPKEVPPALRDIMIGMMRGNASDAYQEIMTHAGD